MSIRNHYVFDYQLVLDEAAEFEKFVDRVKPTNSMYDEPFQEHDTNPFESHEEAVLELEEIKPTGNTTEEDEIINFVHDKNSSSSAEELRRRRLTPYGDEYLAEEADQPQVDKINLKKEYENPPNPDYDPSILQLPPPNRFLKGGSKIWIDDNTFYLFDDARTRDNKPVAEIHRYRFSQRDGKIRLQNTLYWFDRSKNIMAEKKANFKMWVYNIKTRQLYEIKKIKTDLLKPKSRFRNKVKKVFNTLLNSCWNGGNMPPQLAEKFLAAITQAVVKDTGEVVMFPMPDPHKTRSEWATNYSSTHTQTIKLLVTILQHRVGQPVRWLNYVIMQNIYHFTMDLHFQEQILGNARSVDIDLNKEAKKMRRKTIFKMIPNLRKSNHMKTAIKTLFGEDYNKVLIKLFNIIDTSSFITPWVFCMRRGLVPKEAYHWLVNTIDEGDVSVLKEVVDTINSLLSYLMHNHAFESGNGGPIVISYIKICKRLTKENRSVPAWYTWNDMYRMAAQLHIRIRPNKLDGAREVVEIHDKMSSIINRDRKIIQKYKDIVFEEFLSSDKEYGGFKFIQLRTAEELRHEGTVMHHCVGSYASNCVEGSSIIFSMRKDDKSYITIELTPQRGYEILQQYTLHDITITNEVVVNLIHQWHSDCLDLHKDDNKSYYTLCQDKTRAIIAKEVGTVKDIFQGSQMEHAVAF